MVYAAVVQVTSILAVLLAVLVSAAGAKTHEQTVIPLTPGVEQRVEPVAPAAPQQVEAVVVPAGVQQSVTAVEVPTRLEQFASDAGDVTAAVFGATVSIAITVAFLLFV